MTLHTQRILHTAKGKGYVLARKRTDTGRIRWGVINQDANEFAAFGELDHALWAIEGLADGWSKWSSFHVESTDDATTVS